MSDDVRAALQVWTSNRPLGEAAYVHAAKVLAEAYAAEHAEDDGDAITGDWLRAVGFGDDPNWPDTLRILTHSDETSQTYLIAPAAPGGKRDAGAVCLTTYDADGDDECVVIASGRDRLRTRGDVRRLCRALGVPLKGDA